MSDNITTSEAGQKTVQNTHAYYSKSNAIHFYDDNRDGKAAYLNGTETEKGVEMNPVCARNAISGRAYRGTNQLLIQNSQIKEREFITFDQAKNAGTFIRKGSQSIVITIPKEKDKETGEWKPDVIRLFPKSAANNIGAIELAKLSEERWGKIALLRAKNEKEQNPEKKEKTVLAIAHEHLKALDYAEAIGKRLDLSSEDIARKVEAITKGINSEEMKVLDSIRKDRTVPTFDQLCGRAVVESRNNSEHMEKIKAEKGKSEINAVDCHSASEYLGKYLAATAAGARFVTDKKSIEAVQTEINKNLEAEFNKDNYYSAFDFGKEASDRCKEELSAFRAKPREQQLGIEQARADEYNQERPEQDIEMTL